MLLPQLHAHGCVPKVALTCIQLWELCYSSVEQLNLGEITQVVATSTAKQRMQSLAGRLPSCSSVRMALKEYSSYHYMPYTLFALRRYAKQ